MLLVHGCVKATGFFLKCSYANRSDYITCAFSLLFLLETIKR
jgi:hypothetical protein